ncbi:glycosyltransferase family 25 protein [Marinomonas agarivorans]|nr:glycosyltransferase family 25 protein [Marinomonas agarivorans]
MNFLEHVYVIHVKKGYEDRKRHIGVHLPNRGINNFQYVLDGDIDDIKESIYSKHFSSELTLAQASCFYKHILVYKDMVEKNIETVLVLEDDAILVKNAVAQLEKSKNELNSRRNFLVNIERTTRFVPAKIQRSDKLIYAAECTKLTGGYIVHLDVAKKIYDYFLSNKVVLPIDAFQSRMRHQLTYNTFWMEPAVVYQGSKNGTFASELSNRSKNQFGSINTFLNRSYHKYIRSNMSKKRLKVFENVIHYDA